MVKTRLQNQSTQQYRGMIDCFRTLVRTEGARGLYRGLAANLVGITPEKAIKLAVNDTVRARLAARLGVHEDKLPVAYGMLAGATAGMCQWSRRAQWNRPRPRINMQLAATPPGRRAATKVARAVREASWGIRGLYRGNRGTVDARRAFLIMFFPLHAWLKSNSRHLTAPSRLGRHAPAMSIRECFTTIIRNEGAGALFKGWLPRCMIVSPLFGITLLVYEAQQRYLSHIG
ncbi:hypothetical protein, variant [Allomyces macrogynus ATCC 38327]|nr:hypothetical protein, variant [Allomyces macrogynus ATCC 38327]|eukprot:KNE73217.1 hypothetical protein, variant [Allomyces macrogynus ATCC 38327]